jgi:hypothetical protein
VPRYSPTFEPKAGEEKYEVVIAGVRVSLPSSDSMLMLS